MQCILSQLVGVGVSYARIFLHTLTVPAGKHTSSTEFIQAILRVTDPATLQIIPSSSMYGASISIRTLDIIPVVLDVEEIGYRLPIPSMIIVGPQNVSGFYYVYHTEATGNGCDFSFQDFL